MSELIHEGKLYEARDIPGYGMSFVPKVKSPKEVFTELLTNLSKAYGHGFIQFPQAGGLDYHFRITYKDGTFFVTYGCKNLDTSIVHEFSTDREVICRLRLRDFTEAHNKGQVKVHDSLWKKFEA